MVVVFILSMLAVLGSMLAVGAAFTGIGLALRRIFGLRGVTLDDCGLSFWVGYGVTLLVLILWNFALPVGLAALVLVLVAGALGLAWTWPDLRRAFGLYGKARRWELLVLAMGAIWIADRAMAEFASWDGVLYHVQAIKWAKTYAVVPGIANLHGPLAFNNSSFLYDAMLDSGWWEGRGFHLANGTLLLGAALQALIGILRWLRTSRAGPSRHCFAFLMLALVCHLAPEAVSYSSDVPLALVLWAAAVVLYAMLDAGRARPIRTEDAYDALALAILLATAVTIKLPAVVFAALALPVAVAVRFGRRPWRETGMVRPLVWMSLALLLFAGAWTGRGIVMSGYPAFPMAVSGFPVDWRAPEEHADVETAYIKHTEREFTWKLIGSGWVRLVLVKDVNAVFAPSVIAVVAVLVGWRWRRRKEAGALLDRRWWFLLPALLSIGVWFVTVPSHRYGPALFWSLAAFCVTEVQRVLWPAISGRARRLARGVLLMVAVSPLIVAPAAASLRGQNFVQAIREQNFTPPPSHGSALPRLGGEVDVTLFQTRTGLTINVPTRNHTEGPLPNACWNAPLPCTPNPSPNLQLRVPGRLDRGFRVEGRWEMLDFPYYWHAYFLPEWRAHSPRY